MNIADVQGAQLDYWVARAAELISGREMWIKEDTGVEGYWLRGVLFSPSTNWAHGGPIIEQERIAIWPGTEAQPFSNIWTAGIADADGTFRESDEHLGATPLIAAMRAYVASKLGHEI